MAELVWIRDAIRAGGPVDVRREFPTGWTRASACEVL
jgi:hypothetical protein